MTTSTDGDARGVAAGRLVRSSAIVGLGTALSRFTGFLRVVAIASIGFGRLTDVYNVANSTPNIVYELLLGGVLTATLVPLYVEHLHRRDDRGAAAINTFAIMGLLFVTVLGIVAAPWIVKVYTLRLDGPDAAAQEQLAIDLLRLFMPQIFFYGLTALLTAMLNARRRFAAAAFAPALNNVIVIAVFLALPSFVSGRVTVDRVLDNPALVWLLGLGTTLGIVAMTLVLFPALRRTGTGFRLTRHWRDPAVVKLLKLSGWTFGYVAANQVALWVALFLAYGKSGDASVYLAAFVFFQLPHGLFAVSIMTTFTPEMARDVQSGDLAALRAHVATGLRLIGLVMLPASAVLVAMARPIVTAFLQYGDLSQHSANLTAETLAAFGVGLFGFSIYLFVLRAFYAMQDTRTPFLINCVENALNIALAVVLWDSLGVQGLALAWSLSYLAAAVLAALVLRRRVGAFGGRALASSFGRVLIASVGLGVAAALTAATVGRDSTLQAIVAVAAGLAVGTLVLLVAARLLRVEEVGMLRDAIMRRRARVAPEPPAVSG